MILLHRISSFIMTLVVALGFTALALSWGSPLVIILLTVLLSTLILMRLVGWNITSFQSWYLVGTPMLFLLSSFGPLFLLEHPTAKIVLSVIVAVIFFVFAEQIFNFIHLPVNYQPFTLEYLSQLLNILSVFFLATFGFGLSAFLQAPLWALSSIFFLILFFIVYGTLWAGKVEPVRAREFAFAGAILTTEFFAALTFLPVGFYTNAAFLALGVYIFLGLSRAHALHKLSKQVTRRYVLTFIILTIAIASTSQWI